MKVALVPIYVDYYEAIVPGLLKSKELLVRKVREAIGDEHQVSVLDKIEDQKGARFAREQLHCDKPDCLVVLPLVASFSAITDELARDWNRPLILFSALTEREIPKSLSMTKVVAQSQAFGAQAVANGWMRSGVRFHAIHQTAGSDEGTATLRRLLRTIQASIHLSKLRVGLIGDAFEGMSDIALNENDLRAHTGAQIVRIPITRVHAIMADLSSEERARLERELRRRFRFGRFSVLELDYSLRVALAIQKVIAAQQLDCAAFNSHDAGGLKSKKLGLMCALGVTLATSNGCPVSEVGDLCTAFSLWLGRRLGGASFYTEIDSACISAREWLLLNSGEYDLAWKRGRTRPRLVRNTNFAGVNGRGASVCAPLRAGPATIINFTPTPFGEKPYRIQFCEGAIAKPWHPEIGVGNALFVVRSDARQIYEDWLAAGPVHHSATCPGHLAKELQWFCQMRDWTCLHIGR